ncbi:D-alanyl-D-alanine carboxypeptidase family protein [Streptomyces sp. NPDC051555]|uniref:D-alanyl-D-alanine carboxypeptidase family protein n=1 Tax=Streptomyces sp. NPDC051555 TaxID=3365657 RepID=UPI0037958376
MTTTTSTTTSTVTTPLDRGSAMPRRALVALAATALVACAGVAPAHASTPRAPRTPAPSTTPTPGAPGGAAARKEPPAQMSKVGGERLGSPGDQVGAGAPNLPAGLSALSWVVADADTGQVLGARNAHWQLPPASTLKMLFADTVLPAVPHTGSRTVTPEDLKGMGDGSSAVGIVPGGTYQVPDLWRGVFLRSGNDAVHVLAAMNGGVEKTVADMQRRAKELGAGDTNVRSPDGYDAPGQVSSAYDLTLFLRQGLKDKDFKEYCSTASAQFPGGPAGPGKDKPFGISNTNRMLSGADGVAPYPGLIGGKNGYTTNAGNTLAEAAQRDGHTIVVTVMNPQDNKRDQVYTEMRALLDWGFAAAGKATPVGTLDQAGAGGGAAAKGGAAAASTSATGSGSGPGALGWSAIGVGAAAVAGGSGWLLVRRRRRAQG